MLTPYWLGLPPAIWLIIAAALVMCGGLLIQRAPDIAAAIGRRRGMRRWWARINLTDLSDDGWLAELARMRIERSGQQGPVWGREWDPPGEHLGAWLDSDQLWPGDPRRPPQ